MRWRRVPRDAGFTLSELLIVMVLTGIIAVIVGTAVVTGLRKQTQVQDRSGALAQGRTALQRMDRDIRSSNPLKCASATQVVMAEVSTTATQWVTYTVIPQSGSRSEIVVDKTTSAPACGSTTAAPNRATVIGNLVNTATDAVFTFSASTVTVSLQIEPTSISQPVLLTDGGVDLRNSA